MTVTAKELAEVLHGNEYGEEITKEQEKIAEDNNLLVIFGYSDDGVVFNGAIDEEYYAWGGAELIVDIEGRQAYHQNDEEMPASITDKNYIKIKVENKDFWRISVEDYELGRHPSGEKRGLDIARFDIEEYGEKFSDGIILQL